MEGRDKESKGMTGMRISNGSRKMERVQGEKTEQRQTRVKQHLCFDVLIDVVHDVFVLRIWSFACLPLHMQSYILGLSND